MDNLHDALCLLLNYGPVVKQEYFYVLCCVVCEPNLGLHCIYTYMNE